MYASRLPAVVGNEAVGPAVEHDHGLSTAAWPSANRHFVQQGRHVGRPANSCSYSRANGVGQVMDHVGHALGVVEVGRRPGTSPADPDRAPVRVAEQVAPRLEEPDEFDVPLVNRPGLHRRRAQPVDVGLELAHGLAELALRRPAARASRPNCGRPCRRPPDCGRTRCSTPW